MSYFNFSPSSFSSSSSSSSPSPPPFSSVSSSPSPPLPREWMDLDAQTQQVADIIRQVYRIYGDEIGCTTRGHSIITNLDRTYASQQHSDLLYGEILPHGVQKMCDSKHLNANDNGVKRVYDLGAGLGKLSMQFFLQYPHIKHVVGVELAMSRVQQAQTATMELSTIRAKQEQVAEVSVHKDGVNVELIETLTSPRITRHLSFRHQSLFDAVDAWDADLLICETKIQTDMYLRLCNFLARVKEGCRMLTYENIGNLYTSIGSPNPWKQLAINVDNSDRFYTSWALNHGHHFFLWERVGAEMKSVSVIIRTSSQQVKPSFTETKHRDDEDDDDDDDDEEWDHSIINTTTTHGIPHIIRYSITSTCTIRELVTSAIMNEKKVVATWTSKQAVASRVRDMELRWSADSSPIKTQKSPTLSMDATIWSYLPIEQLTYVPGSATFVFTI